MPKKRPCDYTPEESKAAEPKWAKNLFKFVFVMWIWPLIILGPVILLDKFTGFPSRLLGPASNSEYCTPSPYSGCD